MYLLLVRLGLAFPIKALVASDAVRKRFGEPAMTDAERKPFNECLELGWITFTQSLLYKLLEKSAGQSKRPIVQEAVKRLPILESKPDLSKLGQALQGKVESILSFGS